MPQIIIEMKLIGGHLEVIEEKYVVTFKLIEVKADERCALLRAS